MHKLKTRPAWTELQAFNIRSAPQWVRTLCLGKSITHYAQQGSGSTLHIVVWNKRSAYSIRQSDR